MIAKLTIRANDAQGTLINYAAVQGHWSSAYWRNVSASFGRKGTARFTTAWLTGGGTVAFTVDKIIKDGIEYSLSGERTDSLSHTATGRRRGR